MGEILTLNLLTSMAELVRVRAMWYVLPDLTVPNATRVGYRRNPYAKISFNKTCAIRTLWFSLLFPASWGIVDAVLTLRETGPSTYIQSQ